MSNNGLQQFLKKSGWRQKKDLWSSPTGTYRVHEEDAPGTWDRSLAPFLAKAILHARSSTPPDVESVAALEVKRATPLTEERLERFVAEVAPGQSWILFDKQGRVFPHVSSAPNLRNVAAHQLVVESVAPSPRSRTTLFTDLHQWMLKVLLAPQLPEKLLAAPRRSIRNASNLADVADVSTAVASRFVQALDAENQLDTRFGDLRIARPLELLTQWRDRMSHPARVEVAALFARGPTNVPALADASALSARNGRERPPLVLRLHTACELLGLGHVTGAHPMAWTPSLDAQLLESLGLVVDSTSSRVDVGLAVPRFPESIYRARPTSGAPATDVIQCWLETSHYRLRGQEQADFLWRRVLQPAFSS